ncbi:cilia- and flagella-associated protein 97 isoform 1-T1 [Synchiropus picturatus]
MTFQKYNLHYRTSSVRFCSSHLKVAMFSPSELREEVDHSFFDSDTEKGDWNKTDSKPAATTPTNGISASLNREKGKHGKGDHSSGAGSEKNSTKEEASSVSSVKTTPRKVVDDDFERGDNVPSTKSTLRLMAFLAKESNSHGAFSGNSTESEQEKTPLKYSNRRSKRSPKKFVRRQRQLSSSSSSSDADVKSDSSHSDNPAAGSPTKASNGLGTFNLEKEEQHQTSSDNSEDSVTDVSPLSSPCVSPLQSEDQSHKGMKDPDVEEVPQQDSAPSSSLGHIHQEDESHLDDDDSSFSSECQFQDQLLLRLPRPNTRKNFSFSNDEVRRIDRENQRLLQELCRISPRSRPGSAAGQRSHFGNGATYVRPSHSALNRQREQKRIERENLAFLKRLEAVKPTRGLKRSEQLADYHRKTGYRGGGPFGYYMEKQELASSRMWSANRGQRTTSASPQDASPASVNSNAATRTTSAHKAKKSSHPRPLPAWH